MSSRYPAPASSWRIRDIARARSRADISSKSFSESFPIARSNSSSLIERRDSIFSRSRTTRMDSLRPSAAGRPSAPTSGASVRYKAAPAKPAAPIVRLIRTRCSGLASLARTTAAVAATSETSTKKCQGRSVSSFDAARDDRGRLSASVPLIEVAELIVQPGAECPIFLRGGSRGLCRFGAPRPAPRDDDGPNHSRGDTDEIWNEPRQPIEALVNRPGKDCLGAVVGGERFEDLIPVHPVGDDVLVQLRP